MHLSLAPRKMPWINDAGTSTGIMSLVFTPRSALGMPIIHAVTMADILRWIWVIIEQQPPPPTGTSLNAILYLDPYSGLELGT